MRTKRAGFILMIVALLIRVGAVSGQSLKTITLPGGAALEGSPSTLGSTLGFVYAGTIGVVTAPKPSVSSQLFSFSTGSGQIADSADITSDFGPGANPFVQAFDNSGFVAVYGQDSSGTQRVVMFASDQQGRQRSGCSRQPQQSWPRDRYRTG
jgi:hypothetical protein